jgi:cytochrome oxidase Cu insertion factor (SCO1/SenC/PrrC family)
VLLATAPAAAAAGHEGAHAAPAQRAHRPKPKAGRGEAAANRYACPMHPNVTSASPGRCRECGMALKAEPKTEAGAQTKTEAPSRPAATGAGPQSGEAPRIADVPVLDQDGRRLNFYTDLVKGRTVAINFVFTTCTTVCPPLSATFRKVQQELGERAGRDVHLISISVDPVTDTPERLKSFAAKFKAGPGWTFVTGGKPEIGALLKALGAATPDKNDHTPMILVGNDAAGRWTRTYGLAPASALVKVIGEVAAAGPRAAEARPAGGGKALAEASAKYFPNHVLVTQDNKPVRFYDDLLKGKVVLINFMFTTCTGVCPPMTANMAKVRNYLGDRVGRDVVMISISVDPAVDTPERLKKYADNFKAGPGWYFLTGEKQNVDWVLYKLGGYVDDKAKHSATLIIGNEATGEWVKTAALKSPAQIAEAVLELLKSDKN